MHNRPGIRIGKYRISASLFYGILITLLFGTIIFSLPVFLALNIDRENRSMFPAALGEFPVTVDPTHKVITENAQVNAFFESNTSPLIAAVGNTRHVFGNIFAWIALAIASQPWYESLAAADGRFIAIEPGMRKEQVASAFASALAWNSNQKQAFMTAAPGAALPLLEGSFSPGIYSVPVGTTPTEAQALVNEHFSSDVLSHYGTTTAQIVPLTQALTIASLIEREAAGTDDMRIISGIIWNRLFTDMNLQIDATLQYAKANTKSTTSWWPQARPADRYLKSPYNTYANEGLPPSPIANPSVASILAALNPVNTSCLFYFHDSLGQFHCSDTYAEHVALLKQYYGRGK